jgi:aminoglycoside phosphotransferase (APT) family kinase protein
MASKALDIEDFPALITYLRETGRIGADEKPALTNLAGGVSNRTVLVRRENDQAWVIKQALARLRVAVEWFSDPIRIEREADGMAALGTLLSPCAVPKLIFLDRQHHLLAMEAVPQPHDNFKSLLMAGNVQPEHFRQFGSLLGMIHRGGWLGRAEFSQRFADRQFFESLRLEPYYVYAAEQSADPAAADFLRQLVAQTRATANTIVHGDFSPKNILIHAGKLVLLDHEVIHFGDGAFDVGFSFAHLLSKAHHLPRSRTALANAAIVYWNAYLTALAEVPWRSDLLAQAVRHALACLLARCIGRSPLEYLSADERRRQARVVVQLMQRPPATPMKLVREFLDTIAEDQSHADD